MSGHSKWSTIKRKKAVIDAKRGKEFTKLIKEITVAARLGGGDVSSNSRLRLLLDKAKDINMPIDNAQRAIKRGTGELPGQNYEPHMYEGYGPAGIAVIVETLSDNKNRTVAEMRHLFSSSGGSLAEGGAVSWMFEKKGVIHSQECTLSEDEILSMLLDYSIDDIHLEKNLLTVTCDPKELDKVKTALSSQGLKIESADLEWVAQNQVTLSQDQENTAYEFLSELEDHDDVQNVYSNVA